MNPKTVNDLITEALAMEWQEAKEAGALGYMCRSLVQATMPHRNLAEKEFKRTNGAFTLLMYGPNGLPYGSIPRLLVSWLSTEAVRTKQRELKLGDSFSDFIRQLGYEPRGGVRGDITRIKEQSNRLFSSFISCSYVDDSLSSSKNILIAEEHNIWWNPKSLDQIELFPSTVTLTQKFFDEITLSPVPIDMRALKALKRSPMALDIYTWLTYRNSYLRKDTVIPWKSLQMQFGAEYGRLIDFKIAFLEQLKKVQFVYPAARVYENDNGLRLSPSPTHVKTAWELGIRK